MLRRVGSVTPLLTGLVRCGKCGHAMQVSYKEGRFQYVCQAALSRYAKPTCQYLVGRPIDDTVVDTFFEVLQPAEIDAFERISLRQAEHQKELIHHLEKDIMRLEYDAKRAERQYNCVDPENRLIAGTLEKKWESALAELEQAKMRLADARTKEPVPIAIPPELRNVFIDVGRRMPDVWQQFCDETKKRLLRTLITGVNLKRQDDGTLSIRIVWRGSQVTEKVIRMRSLTLRGSEAEKKLVARIRELSEEGLNDKRIADRLNDEGFMPCRADGFTTAVVTKARRRYRIVSNFQKARDEPVPNAYKIPEMAEILGVEPSWIYRNISHGLINVAKDVRYGCYLFPRSRKIVAELRRLKRKEICHVSIPEVH